MVDYDDKVLIILDNSDLVLFDKDSGMHDIIELGYEERPFCMSKLNDKLIIGASNGVVFYASLANLTQPYELPKPPYLGEGASDHPDRVEYPDARVIKVTKQLVSVLFNDKTMVFYDVTTSRDAQIVKVINNHAGSIFALDSYPFTGDAHKFCFLTGSTDKTLRRWIVDANK